MLSLNFYAFFLKDFWRTFNVLVVYTGYVCLKWCFKVFGIKYVELYFFFCLRCINVERNRNFHEFDFKIILNFFYSVQLYRKEGVVVEGKETNYRFQLLLFAHYL